MNLEVVKTFYILCNQILLQVDKTKYHGIMINDDLTLIPQVEYATCKLNRMLGLLRRNVKECLQELREIADFSMVKLIFESKAVKKVMVLISSLV